MKLYYDPDTKTILDNESKSLAPVADLSDSALTDGRDVDALGFQMAAAPEMHACMLAMEAHMNGSSGQRGDDHTTEGLALRKRMQAAIAAATSPAKEI